MHDLIIIGAGPAGMAAGIYASDKKLKTLVFAKEISASHPAEDFSLLSFKELKKEFENQLKINKEFLELHENSEIIGLEKNVVSFSVQDQAGQIYYAKSVIIATGSKGADFDVLTVKDNSGKIKVDGNMKTNIPGIYAAGYVTKSVSGDLFISAGEGAKAALSVLDYLGHK